ncbi:thiamine phosphate synthase [Thiothrix subterranea]|uniref:Thiamine-phosphate synthase n=1 Tax=Thiothrix subterranea TaxID=2735563 RepID=A0AA51MNX6_9GAMM|nr:thiamine phosphate synthase [Thiothrix subterranea]MDQ5769205.1 thiamine phosphate synthase [Thiothrix subterranea]WML87360.1 thiamine phosphate synthase [Thiothrix subterranea]
MQGLYVITDGSTGEILLSKVEQALRGGAAIVQYRDKTTDQARREQEAAALRSLCQQHHALFIINDDVALVKAVQADGVHVGRDDSALTAAREALGTAAIIGVSCYNQLELALNAPEQGADYIAFGSFFPSPTKPNAPRATLELLHQARQQLTLPICAIGGITLENAPDLLANGADMLAVITDVFNSPAIAEQASRYQALVRKHSLARSA